MSRGWKEVLRPVVGVLQPAAKIAERVAQVAVHMKTPTPMGIIGAIGSGISALADHIGTSASPGWSVDMFASTAQIVQAVGESGGTVRVHRYYDGSESAECVIDGHVLWINQRGSVTFYCQPSPVIVEWVRKALDRVLPARMSVFKKQESGGSYHEARGFDLTSHRSEQAATILAATLPLLDGGRCILLDGRPGVGKTTIAQIIARDANLGRVVVLDSSVVGRSNDMPWASASGNIKEALHLLSPGVVVVDDIDKAGIPLAHIEAMRDAARLVVLTANNGQYDEVLDGAIMRAGRVDEVFTIEPAVKSRAVPFDALSDAEWDEVCQWPVAYVNEVAKRLSKRSTDVRLDDLRQRLGRKTRSGEVLK